MVLAWGHSVHKLESLLHEDVGTCNINLTSPSGSFEEVSYLFQYKTLNPYCSPAQWILGSGVKKPESTLHEDACIYQSETLYACCSLKGDFLNIFVPKVEFPNLTKVNNEGLFFFTFHLTV